MGDSTLNKLASPPTEVESSTEDLNQILDALYGDIVMRNTSGVVTDGAGDIGQINSGRPDRIHVKTAITIGGQTLNTTPFLLSKTGIQSGAAKASGFPNFLSPAGGTTRTFDILGATTPLNMTIDGAAKELEADLTSDSLALAPATNNTCGTGDINLTYDTTQVIGEHGYWLDITYDGMNNTIPIGSEISALDGTVQAFLIDVWEGHGIDEAEVFLAKVDTTNNKLIPILRGIAGTPRATLSCCSVPITLLKAHYIFLDNDLLTIDTSTIYPTWGPTAPDTPATGQYWWDTAAETWKRYSGSTWEILGRIYLGYAICDSAGCKWVEHVDFDLAWDNFIEVPRIEKVAAGDATLKAPFSVNVAGKLIHIGSDIVLSPQLGAGWFWVYFYMKPTGEVIASKVYPRKKDIKKGLYYPGEYWRCIGTTFVHYGADANCIQNKFGRIEMDKNEDLNPGEHYSGVYGIYTAPTTNSIADENIILAGVLNPIGGGNDAVIKIGNPSQLTKREVLRMRFDSLTITPSTPYSISGGNKGGSFSGEVGCAFEAGFFYLFVSGVNTNGAFIQMQGCKINF